MKRWQPSLLFKLFHRKQYWSIEQIDYARFLIHSREGDYLLSYSFNGWSLLERSTGNSFLLTRNGIQLFEEHFGRGEIFIDAYGKELKLFGVTDKAIHGLMDSLTAGEDAVRALLAQFQAVWRSVQSWEATTRVNARNDLAHRGWVSSRFQKKAIETRPTGITELLSHQFIADMIEERPAEYLQTLQFWEDDHANYFQFLNEMHVDKSVKEHADFFNTVEKSPLTLEQRIPITCNDNKVLLVASAGSGKTSTLIAKAGYSLLQGHSLPSSTLMLAFNREAADELRNRLIDRLRPLGLPAHKIQVKTFHSLSLEIIEDVTGEKPVIAPWTQSDQGKVAQVIRFISELNERDHEFNECLTLLSFVLGLDLPSFEQELVAPDSWDKSLNTGFQSLLDESLESPMHVVVANWLTVHGVRYVYRAKPESCGLPKGCSHNPTFYLPGTKSFIEVWDVDATGSPPPGAEGYRHLIQLARAVHGDNKTSLIELYNSSLRQGFDFGLLKTKLRELGEPLYVAEPTEFKGRKPLELDHLANMMKSFISHIKANRWKIHDLYDNLSEPKHKTGFPFRAATFLKLVVPVYQKWEALLAEHNHIDFDDMVNRAADYVGAGRWRSPYKLVLVDEFQDTSRSRAELLKVLTVDDETCLFCVGDDWQSINGFAGADVSVMSRFDTVFQDSTHFKLETTFRCPQSLCDISTKFITKNPSQIPKEVYSAKADVFEPVRVIEAPLTMQPDLALLSALSLELTRLDRLAETLKKHFTVMVLGRYNYDKYFTDKSLLPAVNRISLKFLSVHQAKGLEADYVIVPRMSSAAYAFPCQTKDDSSLQLALAYPDNFPFSEERRLFYVALTRARYGVSLITNKGLESPFITELIEEHGLKLIKAEAAETTAVTCPACMKGFLVEKKGKSAKGPYSFYGCNRFPVCKKTYTSQEFTKLKKSP